MTQIQNNCPAYTTNDNRIIILHVDDDTSILEVSKQILLLEGVFEIDQVLSVDDAFKKLESKHYDVIVCDFDMPGKGAKFVITIPQKGNSLL